MLPVVTNYPAFSRSSSYFVLKLLLVFSVLFRSLCSIQIATSGQRANQPKSSDVGLVEVPQTTNLQRALLDDDEAAG